METCAQALAAAAGKVGSLAGLETSRGGLPATGGGFLLLGLAVLALALVVRARTRRAALGLILVLGLAAAAAAVPVAHAQTSTENPVAGCLLAGADAANITPFTADAPTATSLDPLANTGASNPDGLPGGLWDQITGPAGITSTGQVSSSGMWGEAFVDANGNHRHEEGEDFTDDPFNTAVDADATRKYDGIYLGGFGNDRMARGPFDQIWARTVFVKDAVTNNSVAMVSVDFIGYFSDRNPQILARARELDANFDADAVVIAHTHDHQGPDMVGLWGPYVPGQDAVPRDGTYPKYERYVEEKIARSLVAAFQRARPARFRSGVIRNGESFVTLRGNTEDLTGLQTKGNCRTPWFFDDELRAFQLQGLDGTTVATGINWGMHIESMEDGNQYLSSDNPNTARRQLEEAFGGVALYLQGAQGSVEVVGDSCTRRWKRDTFDGEQFPVREDGQPLAFETRPGEDVYVDPTQARDRTYAMGRVIGSAAVAALQRAAWDVAPTVDVLTPRDAYFPANNGALLALTAAGTIDKQAYLFPEHRPLSAGELTSMLGVGSAVPSGIDVKTTLYAWRIGGASFLTAPGELFPELYYGVARVNRTTPTANYQQANPAAFECSARPFHYDSDPTKAGAHTGRPYEPSLRDAQVARFNTGVNFLVGYAPDLLGYIVPGYDFTWYVAPGVEGVGVGALEGEADDPCKASPPDLAFPDARYSVHYHETNSASSVLAPGIACGMVDLLQGPTTTADDSACKEYRAWRTAGLAHLGLGPVIDPTNPEVPVGHY
jgi:hypothetical protein